VTRPVRLLVVLAIAGGLIALAVALTGGEERAPRPPTASPPPGDFIGLIPPGLASLDRAGLDGALDDARTLHAGLVRQTFDWSVIEPRPRHYDFAQYDGLMSAAAARGIRVLPVLFNPPGFRSSGPPRPSPRGTFPPRRPADLGAFGAVLARRYGPGGSFWRAHPALPADPIRAWQVWNEPSLPVYWPTGPSPKAYARLLAATASGIRGVDPRATIVSAGIPQSRIGVPFGRYVEGLYRAGAATSFDALAIHPYARDAAGVVAAIAQARRIMDRHGDHSPIWVTEVGWASAGPASDFTVGPRGQAERVRTTLLALGEQRRRLNLRGVVYFGLRDSPLYAGGKDFWGLHTGLQTLAGEPKPAFAAFENSARRLLGRYARPSR
jgi:polysaccharide biosynthesis protein PslG